MSDNRPPVYWEGETLIIRASAIGTSCMWELIAAGQGYSPAPVPKFLREAFDEGTELEPVILERVKQAKGWKIFGEQIEGELGIPGYPIVIRYHPDGLIEMKPLGTKDVWFAYVGEVKALSDGLWQPASKNGVETTIAEYKWQLSVMMIHQQMPGMWIAYNKGKKVEGKKVECEDEGKILYQTVNDPFISWKDIQAKAIQIYEGVCGDDVVMSGKPCDDPSHFPCRYLHIRPEPEEEGKVLMVEGEDVHVLNELLRSYILFKGQEDEAKGRRAELKNEILDYAGDAKRLVTDEYSATIVENSSSRFNWKQFAEDHPDIDLDMYKERSTYKYLQNVKRHVEEL